MARKKKSPARGARKKVPTIRGRAGQQPLAGKKRSPVRPLQRPAAWWRTPIPAKQLAGLPADEAAIFIAQERLRRVEVLKQQLRDLRIYSRDFTPSKGYTLNERALVRLAPARLKKLRAAHVNLVRAKSKSYITASPRTAAQRKSIKQHAGEVIPGQKKFLIHTDRAKTSRVEFDKGQAVIVDKVKGGETYHRIYLFPRKPRDWEDVRTMTEKIQRKGMRHGNYKLRNSLYGDIGTIISHDKLQEVLTTYFGTYNRYMAGTIIGWRWYGSSYSAAKKTEKKAKTTEDRFKEMRQYLAYKEKRRIDERLGRAKKCKRCKRRRCKCKPPEFK